MYSYALLAISIGLLGYLGYGDFIEARETGNLKAMRYQRRSLFIVLGVVWLSYSLFESYSLYKEHVYFFRNRDLRNSLIVLFSFAISFLWFLFFKGLDIFEKEKISPLILIFILACGSTFLVFPIGGFIRDNLVSLDGTFINDFLYCVIAIGFPEELVKIIPFLLMLWLSKNINEPYDYILYGGICALGFAFVENIQYLSSSNMSALGGRALYSTVSHIFDTAIICYSLALAKYNNTNRLWAFIQGYVLAALAHGFYDFWLITESYSFPWATILFFLVSIHLLTMMINNLLNISPYYQPEKRLRTARYKFYLTTYLIVLCALGFIFILFSRGAEEAGEFGKDLLITQSYTLAYLVISFSSLNIIHGYLMPLNPRKILLPLVNRYPNYLGVKVMVTPLGKRTSRLMEPICQSLPIEMTFSKRVVVEGNFNWYFLTGDHFAESWKSLGHQLLVTPVKFEHHLLNGKSQACRLAIITSEDALGEVELIESELRPLGNVSLKTVSRGTT